MFGVYEHQELHVNLNTHRNTHAWINKTFHNSEPRSRAYHAVYSKFEVKDAFAKKAAGVASDAAAIECPYMLILIPSS